MPASSINLYHMQDAKNNFNAVRPVPLCADANYFTSPCQNIHISTNCYYGYQNQKNVKNLEVEDCEMMEVSNAHNAQITHDSAPSSNGRKRSAEDYTFSRNKRLREEVQTKKSYEPETNEKKNLERKSEEFMEDLYWNIHGGTLFSCINSYD